MVKRYRLKRKHNKHFPYFAKVIMFGETYGWQDEEHAPAYTNQEIAEMISKFPEINFNALTKEKVKVDD